MSSIVGDKFICKQHACDDCQENFVLPTKRKQLYRCFRCPKAYDAKHRPRDVHVLLNEIFLCIKHIQEDEIWPEMSAELKLKLELNQNKVTLLFTLICSVMLI